jgi:pimeloyl-ACP methyl ester carboxylesterase
MATTQPEVTTSHATDGSGTDRTVGLDGDRQVAYAEYGDPDGVPVVFFHGTPGSRYLGALFEDHAREVGVRLLAPDRPGYGNSTRRAEWQTNDGAEQVDVTAVVAVLDDAGVDSAGVVAFSGGARPALALAATHPDRVRGIDLVSTAVPPSLADETPAVQRTLGALATHVPPVLRGLLRAQGWAAARKSPSFVLGQYTDDADDITDEDAAVFRRDFLEAVRPSRAGVTRELAALARPWSVELDAIEHEVAVHHGTDDANAPSAGARRLADTLTSGAFRPVEGADHATALLRRREKILDKHASLFSE